MSSRNRFWFYTIVSLFAYLYTRVYLHTHIILYCGGDRAYRRYNYSDKTTTYNITMTSRETIRASRFYIIFYLRESIAQRFARKSAAHNAKTRFMYYNIIMYSIPAICARIFELNRIAPARIVVHTPYVAFDAIPRTHSV
jgi:hypothetical protein